ncbi:Piwi domain-containing protein [Heracleum sosnowskyi]|uniref:Piwi domain-containing protein n=1 Tax=Heracleum sosnowskyi TaxID=360622 RepID=A0AAD8IJI3_9APIA|nr:Piwi domain-containing protein [Heracleum sosnowskyi]
MMKKKFVNAGTVQRWICINFAENVSEAFIEAFCNELASVCLEHGLKFNLRPVVPHLSAPPANVERVVKDRYFEAKEKIKENKLDLLIVILPDDSGLLYGNVKRICETDIGIISQCCKAKKVLEVNHQFLEGLVLKLNVKMGGRNAVLVDAIAKRIPVISELPTIIFGADISHPNPGKWSSPTFSAVVASQDWPEITTYAALVSKQPNRRAIIEDLFNTRDNVSGGIREHLISFKEKTGFKPSRIIFYRDGVNQGHSSQVLIHEVDAIRRACNSLEDNYQPRITFIVVQKGHHTKFFPYHQDDPSSEQGMYCQGQS